jgi:flagellar hook-length control protein FliK
LEKEFASPKLNSDVRASLENSTQRLSGDESFSKVNTESQAHQDTNAKMDKVFSDELGIKVTKVDTPNNENGSLNSQHQSSDRVWETSSSSKTIESGHRELSAQTIDQIVRRASIQLRNGHNEASIELKPEYLGHIRMQVSTENHQVTVRILAELPFVKEMIENNLNQLKTDLQQQGLDVDKLEVSVSDYSETHEHAHKNDHQLSPQEQKDDGQETDTAAEDAGRDSNNSVVTRNSTATVDYFA